PARAPDRRPRLAPQPDRAPRPRRRLRPVRLPARDRVRLRVRAHAGGDGPVNTLRSFVGGRWVEGTGALDLLLNPATEEPLARAGAGGIDRAAVLAYARDVGGPALRALTFAERGTPLTDACDAIAHA